MDGLVYIASMIIIIIIIKKDIASTRTQSVRNKAPIHHIGVFKGTTSAHSQNLFVWIWLKFSNCMQNPKINILFHKFSLFFII